MSKNAKFVGGLKVEFSSDGKWITLLNDISFIDSQNKKWTAKKGMPSDGASIPSIFWPIIGSPLQGAYVRPAVIHDQYCIIRIEPCKKVHKMFYEAMCVAGVDELKARIMYLAVMACGPRWDEMTVVGSRSAFGRSTKSARSKKTFRQKIGSLRLHQRSDHSNFALKVESFPREAPISRFPAIRLDRDECPRRQEQSTTVLGKSIDNGLISEMRRKTTTVARVKNMGRCVNVLTINVPQSSFDITETDKDRIVEFATANKNIDALDHFADSLRLEKKIKAPSGMNHVVRYRKLLKMHTFQIEGQSYLLECTHLDKKHVKALVTTRPCSHVGCAPRTINGG